MNENKVAQAFLYPLVGSRKVIKVKYNQEDHSGLASLPDLPLANYYSHFQQLVHQHVAVVTVDGQRFVVGGWEYRAGKRKVPASKSLSQVKRRTIWHGEVIVLVLGTRTPYQARPRIKRHLIDRAAAVYVSRVSEAYDLHIDPPIDIIM